MLGSWVLRLIRRVLSIWIRNERGVKSSVRIGTAVPTRVEVVLDEFFTVGALPYFLSDSAGRRDRTINPAQLGGS